MTLEPNPSQRLTRVSSGSLACASLQTRVDLAGNRYSQKGGGGCTRRKGRYFVTRRPSYALILLSPNFLMGLRASPLAPGASSGKTLISMGRRVKVHAIDLRTSARVFHSPARWGVDDHCACRMTQRIFSSIAQRSFDFIRSKSRVSFDTVFNKCLWSEWSVYFLRFRLVALEDYSNYSPQRETGRREF